jgi:hypothetical protein
MRRTIHWLAMAALVTAGALAAASVRAQPLCDFIAGGGSVQGDFNAPVNFGVHAGCKRGAFWGHVNVLDKGFGPPPGHLKSIRITAYFPGATPNSRHICGEGEVVKDSSGNSFAAKFHAKVEDNARQGRGADRFGLRITEAGTGNERYHLSMRVLETGNVEFHKANSSTTGPGQIPQCEVAPPGEFADPIGVPFV